MRRIGSEAPRICTPPLRELTPETTLGFDFAEFCERRGEPLYPWQRWLAVHALELLPDGHLRFRTVVAIVGRQNGKTHFSRLVIEFFLSTLCVACVLGTSSTIDKAEEVWDAVVDDFDEDPVLAGELDHVRRRNGAKDIVLTDRRVYKVRSATRRGCRGISADLVFLDELREQRNWDAWGAATKTTVARPNAQVWCISNAGDESSVVLWHLRKLAHQALGDPDGFCGCGDPTPDGGFDAETEDDAAALGWFEWSAPPDAGTLDPEAYAMANPSMGHGLVTERALRSAALTDPEDLFRVECLCQWPVGRVGGPFPAGVWEAGVDVGSAITDGAELFFGIDQAANRDVTSVAVCGLREDGALHCEVIARRTGFSWCLPFIAGLVPEGGTVRLAMQGRGCPVASHIDELAAVEGVSVELCQGRDLGAFCARFYDAVMSASPDTAADAVPVYHRPQPFLDDAVASAQRKELGDGAFCWDRRRSPVDVSPLVACTMALGLATGGPTEDAARSAYADGAELIVL